MNYLTTAELSFIKPNEKSLPIQSFYISLAIFSLLVLIIKIFFITKTYSYIYPGNDPAYMMDIIQEMISSKSFYFETMSRSFIPYFSMALKLISNISSVHVLLVPTVGSLLLGFFLTYILSRELFNNSNIALLSSSMYAVGSSLFSLNSVIFFGILLIPMLAISIIKYFKNKTCLSLVAILLLSGLNFYSQLFLVYLIVLSAFVACIYIISIKRQDVEMIDKCAYFFIIVFITFFINYFLINNLVPEEYKGFDKILWFLAGFQRSDIASLPYLYSIYYVFFAILLILFLLKFILHHNVMFAPRYLARPYISIFKLAKCFSTKFARFINLIYSFLLPFILLFLFVDLFSISMSFEFFKNINFAKHSSISSYLFESWLPQDVWRNSIFHITLLYLISIFGLLYVFYRTKWNISKYFGFILILSSLQLLGSIASQFIPGASDIGGQRGFYSTFILIFIIFSFTVYYIFMLLFPNIYKLLLSILVLILSFSTILLVNHYSNYIFRNDPKFIDAMTWFERNSKNRSFVYIEPYYPHNTSIVFRRSRFNRYLTFEHDTDLYNLFGRYYIFSFFSSKVPYVVNDLINFKQLYYNNFYLFSSLLDKYKIRYLIFDKDNYPNLKFSLDPISNIVFQNDALIIAEYSFVR